MIFLFYRELAWGERNLWGLGRGRKDKRDYLKGLLFEFILPAPIKTTFPSPFPIYNQLIFLRSFVFGKISIGYQSSVSKTVGFTSYLPLTLVK
jgi:hypothetical protein